MQPDTAPLYQQVAQQLEEMIRRGVLRAGERLPSLRHASKQHNVSMTTAIEAYTELENRGLVEARRKSGFFVRPLRARVEEPRVSRPKRVPNAVTVGALQSRLFDAAARPDVLALGGAVPGAELLPTAKLNRILASLARSSGVQAVTYDSPAGCEALRREIAKRSLDSGADLLPDDIITTCGATEALMLCLRAVTKPGDVVAVESPTYFGVLHALEELGLKAIEVPMHSRHGMDLEALERIVKSRSVAACVAVANFNNPLGSLMPLENKEKLAGLLARHDVPLIEDDVFGEIHFTERRPQVVKSFDRKGLILLCSSFSKTLAPGYRVGWVAPGRFYDKVKALKLTSTLAAATLPQLAVAEFLANGGYDRHLRTVREAYAANLKRMSLALAETFPKGTRITQPQGGFVLWIELPAKVRAIEMHDLALREKINLAPGPMFSPVHGYQNFIRLSCGLPWSTRIQQAVGTLGRLVHHMM
jgi:DNA-binding transcriptional MocR family regulator